VQHSAEPAAFPARVAFVSTASSVNTEYLTSGRVDYNINAQQKLYFRISRDAGVQASSTSPINPVFNGISPQPWVIPQLNYTYVITPRLVNNLVLNGNYYSAVFYGSTDFKKAQSLLPLTFAFTDGGAGDAGFQGVGPAAPEGRLGQQLGIIDDLSWELGKHTLQFGVNNRNNRITSTANQTGTIIGTTLSAVSPTGPMATLRTAIITTASLSHSLCCQRFTSA
jgi:hypothetical protein